MNEKVKKIVKWIAVIAAAIGAAAAVIMEQGCTHKHFLKASGIKIDTIEVSTSTRVKQTLSEPTHFGQNTSQAIAVICCYV